MPVPSPIFNGQLIRLINKSLRMEEHLFILGHKDTFDELCLEYGNVVFESFWGLSTVNRYDADSAILVLHSLFLSSAEICRLESKCLKRIVWCVWGHDLYRRDAPTSLLSRYEKWLSDRKIRKFRAIVAGFKYDEYEIRKRFGCNIPVHNALYSSGYFYDDIDDIVCRHQRIDKRTNIMIGHSSYPFLQHEKQLERLARYKDENIVITLILCYGDKEYTDRVIKRASEIFGSDKLNVVCDFMEWKSYIELLCDVDIAIFDFEHQAAFGNLILLSYLGKKLYLSSTGVMYKSFQKEQVDVYNCLDIGCVEFSQFQSLKYAKIASVYVKSLLNRQNILVQWNSLFQQLQQ